MSKHDTVRAIRWQDGRLTLLDQRLLPREETYIHCDSASAVATAIRDMVVRGAPAIGISAAYGLVLAARAAQTAHGADWAAQLEPAFTELAASRPTAVNLFWALGQMRAAINEGAEPDALEQVATDIHRRDHEDCQRMGDAGAALIPAGTAVYTHCNTGSLATAGYGTALGVIRSAYRDGLIEHVYAGETRPWLQGARLTAWELMRDDIPVTLLVEGAAATVLQHKNISWVIVGADRICANGDVANKIGTCNLAVMARHYGVRFMVAAPCNTIDPATAAGTDIIIEERPGTEITSIGDKHIAADACPAFNPVFDVTPADLIDCLVTERGCIMHPNKERIAEHLAGAAV